MKSIVFILGVFSLAFSSCGLKTDSTLSNIKIESPKDEIQTPLVRYEENKGISNPLHSKSEWTIHFSNYSLQPIAESYLARHTEFIGMMLDTAVIGSFAFGDTEEVIYEILPKKKLDKILKIEQRYTTGIDILGGKVMELEGWNNRTSEWEEVSVKSNRFVQNTYSIEEVKLYPDVTEKEVLAAVKELSNDSYEVVLAQVENGQLAWYPVISKIEMKITSQDSDGNVTEDMLRIQIQIGC